MTKIEPGSSWRGKNGDRLVVVKGLTIDAEGRLYVTFDVVGEHDRHWRLPIDDFVSKYELTSEEDSGLQEATTMRFSRVSETTSPGTPQAQD